MWYFFGSSDTWLLIAFALIGYLIWLAVKSAARSLSTPMDKATADENWRKYKEAVGPMTWPQRIFTILFFAIFIAFVVWLASVT